MKISVICPVYDTPEEILQQAVKSVFEQDIHQKCEVILVDDASNNPGTIACLQRLKAAYDRIKLIRLPANKGPSSARAAGIRVASGKWIVAPEKSIYGEAQDGSAIHGWSASTISQTVTDRK